MRAQPFIDKPKIIAEPAKPSEAAIRSEFETVCWQHAAKEKRNKTTKNFAIYQKPVNKFKNNPIIKKNIKKTVLSPLSPRLVILLL